MSLIFDRYECGHCGKYDLPLGLRRGSDFECVCGASIYDGKDRRANIDATIETIKARIESLRAQRENER